MEMVDSLYSRSRGSFPSRRVSSRFLIRNGVSPTVFISSGLATEAYGSEQIQVSLRLTHLWKFRLQEFRCYFGTYKVLVT